VHYQRPDDDYTDWGLHLWGDAIADGVGTEWDSPRPPDGTDDFGAYWNVPLQDATKPLNFIIHKGDEKDPGPDQSFIPAEDASKWVMSGDETLHAEKGGALGWATLHYHRPDGDYGDYTSDDFNDFWGLHTWADAADPGWTTPRKPARFDGFGAVFEVELIGAKTEFGYILHRGDEKDPGVDQALNVKDVGYEVWQLQGADPEDPYLLPMPPVGPVSKGNLDEERAYWVDEDTILWAAADDPGAEYRLHHAPDGCLALTDAGVSGDSVVLGPGTASDAVKEKFPHLKDLPALKISADDLADVPTMLTGQVAVAASAGGVRLDATGLQIPGVLDDLYATDADLGTTWSGETPTVALWAPTAKSVTLQLFDDSGDNSATEVVMDRDGGVWSTTGDADWAGKQYLFDVEVFVPSTGGVEHNLVTDPYSVALSTNSARSMVVDLSDQTLEPEGWDEVAKPSLAQPEDISVYELHVRDFSASDTSVPPEQRGTFEAFALEGTNGTDHLERLADAGLTHVHLLPAFDFATVDEDRTTWQQPDDAALGALGPDSDEQQAAVSATADMDGFNWGYDPWHYTVPEGSYSTDPEGGQRIVEFRDMVAALNADGLRVVMDVVYNHTTAAGQDPKSVLDRVVPGYYHRLDDTGAVETSTCCSNTASEHDMMGKLMVDSVVTWATQYKVDGFRFDLMGHHTKQNMLDIRAALDALTLADDGVDGEAIYLYGEGWNFGEVADDARFVQATQLNMAGTGIGTFNDRHRDAVRGGGPFDGGDSLVLNQGIVNGLWYDPNEMVVDNGPSEADQKAELLLSADQVRVGLAGNLADYQFVDRTGTTVTGSQVDYNGSPTGYTADPQENIVYVEAHDNQTLFDISQYKHPLSTSMADRVRAQNVGVDLTVLSQGVPFVHAGMEMLRSKSMDRDSYNSGDWFNKLDFSYQSSNWGVGLPVADKNQDNWYLIGPRLADPSLKPAQADIESGVTHLEEMLQVRSSSPLFRLPTAELVSDRLGFANTGPEQVPGLVVMTLADPAREPLPGGDLDPDADGLVVLFNATDDEVAYEMTAAKGADITLHPVQAESADPAVRTAAFDADTGTFTVPARTTAVFVEAPADVEPPTVDAELVPIQVGAKQGKYTVKVSCTDNVTADCVLEADINGVPVADGDVVQLIVQPGSQSVDVVPGTGSTRFRAPDFTLTVTCTDEAGNTTTETVTPQFRLPGTRS
jgi:pullulanase-type alpha-1,6-glucosidase